MTESRNIFSELVEGFEALAAEREGKKNFAITKWKLRRFRR